MLQFFCAFLFIAFPFLLQAQEGPARTSPIAGEAELMSHFVERGLSHSDKDPALQASFWFNFGPQFRAGIGGTNVGYQGSDSRFLLKYNADIKIDFTDNINLTIDVSNHNYYKPETRNGWVYALRFRLYEVWRLKYESLTNWEATQTAANHISLTYDYLLSERWKAPVQFGYTMVSADAPAYKSYFDLRGGAHFEQNEILKYKIDLTWNSNAAQFPGRAGIFLILGVQLAY